MAACQECAGPEILANPRGFGKANLILLLIAAGFFVSPPLIFNYIRDRGIRMAKDYYETLGVGRGAGADEIKSAYKGLAKKYHPDVNKEKGMEEKFKEIQHAYAILGDAGKRAQYDQFGADFEKGGAGGGFSGFQGFEGGFGGAGTNFEDIFESMGFGSGFSDLFGQGFSGQRRGPQRGQDIALRLNLTFEEAAFGTTKEIEIERVEECEACSGSGAKPGTRPTQCTTCHGSGVERATRRTFLGTISTQMPCHRCSGKGEIIGDLCSACSGTGKAKRRKKITVDIPEGVDSGNQLRVGGQGNAGGRGASRGNLVLVISVQPHRIFRRNGTDIYMEAPISFSEAALGAEVEVPTLSGKARLHIPQGTQSGTVFRMAGKGIKELEGSSHGDQFVKATVKTPQKPSKKEKELLEKLAGEEKVAKERKGLFDKLKGMF